ncbi:hypothetical protein HZA76_01640 [Candidatus Roizmanbacteria bacterium]|nr:hypothetical protein [Candidatus Roizmanbacteria bacterium]
MAELKTQRKEVLQSPHLLLIYEKKRDVDGRVWKGFGTMTPLSKPVLDLNEKADEEMLIRATEDTANNIHGKEVEVTFFDVGGHVGTAVYQVISYSIAPEDSIRAYPLGQDYVQKMRSQSQPKISVNISY